MNKNNSGTIESVSRKLQTKDFLFIAILTAICIYLFVFRLGGASLWETDEPIYGEVAKEILKTGDWISLRFNYKTWFDKPPLYMWITAFFYRMFGVGEFTTRITSALFGIAHVILVYFCGKILFNQKVGFFSALMLATAFQFILQSRLALLDVPLSFFVTFSLLLFYVGHINPDRSRYYILSSACMALATLTKGPVGLIIPAFIIGIYLFLTKNLSRLKKMRLPAAILVFFLIASPWYIIEVLRHGQIFIDKFFLVRTVSRYTTSFEEHTGPFYYYVGVLFLGFFPWSSFLPLSFFHVAREVKKSEQEKNKSLFILTWFVFIFLFFSFARSKLPGYIFSVYPACALSVGKFWENFFVGEKVRGKKGFLLSFLFYFLLMGALVFLLFFAAEAFLPSMYSSFATPFFLIIVALFGAGFICFMGSWFKKNIWFSLMGLVGGMCFVVWVLVVHILPLTEVFKPTKSLAKRINSVIQPGQRIGNYPTSDKNFMSFNCSLVYYTDRRVKGIEDKQSLKTFLASKHRVFCVMEEKDYQRIKDKLPDVPVHCLEKKGGKVLISNQK